MKKVNEAAALHFAEGCLRDNEVPVGDHDLSRVRVILTFPDGAAVQRGEGSEGDGHEAEGAGQSVNAVAALLFIKKSGIKGPTSFGLWKSCILEAAKTKLKAKDLTPPEAVEAMREIHEAIPDDEKPTKKTSASRVGVAGVEISVERLTIKSFEANDLVSARG